MSETASDGASEQQQNENEDETRIYTGKTRLFGDMAYYAGDASSLSVEHFELASQRIRGEALIMRHLKPEAQIARTILDVNSGSGSHVVAYMTFNPKTRIVCVEGDSHRRKVLCLNVGRHENPDRVKVCETLDEAVGALAGEAVSYVHIDNTSATASIDSLHPVLAYPWTAPKFICVHEPDSVIPLVSTLMTAYDYTVVTSPERNAWICRRP